MSDSLGQRMASGATWMLGFKTFDKVLGIASTVILARLLAPADFGIVAMATAFIAGIELFGQFSFDIALIQKPDPQREHYDTAWTFNLLFGVIASTVLLAAAWPAEVFFSQPGLRKVIGWLALGTLLQGLENIGIVDFRRSLNFRREFLFLSIKRTASFCSGVILTVLLRNHWALVTNLVLTRLFGLVLSYVMSSYRPRPSLARARELLSFSTWLAFHNVVYFLRFRSQDFIIGRLIGPAQLGFFNLASEFANLSSTEIVAPVNRALLPAYARLQDDLEALRVKFLEVLGLVALVALPMGTGLAVCSAQIVELLLGSKWSASAPLLQILAISGVLIAIQSNVGVIYVATGNPRIVTLIGVTNVAVLLPLLILQSNLAGLEGAAWAMLEGSVVLLLVNLGVANRLLGTTTSRCLAQLWRPAVAATIIYPVVSLAESALGGFTGAGAAFVQLALLVPLGAVVYVGALLLLWLVGGRPPGAEQIIGAWLLERWQPPAGRASTVTTPIEYAAGCGVDTAADGRPSVQVIIPTTCAAERAESLARALHSIRSQEHVRAQPVVVVNGDRFDPGTYRHLRSDPSITVHYLQTGSAPLAAQFGRRQVTAPFFAFLDDDDELLPRALWLRISPLLADPGLDVVVTNGLRRIGDVDFPNLHGLARARANPMVAILEENWLASCGALYRSSSVSEDLFEGNAQYFEWTLLGIRLCRSGARLHFLDEPTYRINESTRSLSKSLDYELFYVDFLERLATSDDPKEFSALLRRKLSRAYHTRSALHLARGNLGEAFRDHLASLRSAEGYRHLPFTWRLVWRWAARLCKWNGVVTVAVVMTCGVTH